jgi:hypothetical protein
MDEIWPLAADYAIIAANAQALQILRRSRQSETNAAFAQMRRSVRLAAAKLSHPT